MESMPLFKFCHPAHHIQRAATLKVGTLHGYRALENPELRDSGEGKYDFSLSFDGEVTLETRLANLLLSGAVGFGDTDGKVGIPGNFSAYVERLQIVRSDPKGVTVADTQVNISRSLSNCLVFCMSQLDDARQCPFEGYDAHWSIRDDAAEVFVRRLGNLIFQHAKLSSFEPDVRQIHSASSVQSLQLSFQHRRVIYRDRNFHVTRENVPSFDDVLRLVNEIPFVKPIRFSNEQEYRFTFTLADGQRLFIPIGDVYLPLSFIGDLN